MAKTTLEKLKDQLNLTAGSGDTVTNNSLTFNDNTRTLRSTITTDKGSFSSDVTIPGGGGGTTAGVSSITAGSSNVHVTPVTGKGDVTISVDQSTVTPPQPTTISSTDLDVSQTGYNANIGIKTQSSTSSISESNGLFDVRADNETITKDNSGRLKAIGGGGSTGGQPTMLESTSLDINQTGYRAEIELKPQSYNSTLTVDSTGTFDVKVDGSTVKKDSLGRLTATAAQGAVTHNRTLAGQGTATDPLTVNVSTASDNAIGRDIDGSLFVPKLDSGIMEVKHDATLKGTGKDTDPMSVSISEDAGNTLAKGSDGGLFTMAGSGGSGQPTNFDSPENTITFTGDASSYSKHADVKVSELDNNMLSKRADGLYVSGMSGGSTPTLMDSPNGTLNITGGDYNKHLDVKISSASDNAIEVRNQGLFVSKASSGGTTHDNTLKGDGAAHPLGVAITDREDNILIEDIEGKLWVPSTEFKAADNTIGVIKAGSVQELFVKISGAVGNILHPKNDGLFVKMKDFISKTLKVTEFEDEINIELQDQPASSAIEVEDDGTLDVKVDHTTITKSAAGVLSAVGGGGTSTSQPTNITSPSTTITVGGSGYDRTVDLNASLREKITNVTNPHGAGIEAVDQVGNIGLKIGDKTPAHINTSGELIIDAIDREHYYYSPQLAADVALPSSINQLYDVETGLKIDDNQEIRPGSLVADVDRRILVVTKSTTTTPTGSIAISRGLVNVVGPKDITTDSASHTERAISIIGDASHPVLRVNVDPAAGNALTLTNNGLYVPHEDAGTGSPTDIQSPKHSLTVGGSGFTRTVDIAVSATAGNQATIASDGLFVAPQQPPEATKFADITGQPSENTALAGVLAGKVNVGDNHDIPTGGVKGKVLKKVSSINWDVEWGDEEIDHDHTLTGTGHTDSPLSVNVSDKSQNLLTIDGDQGLLVDGSNLQNTTHLVSPSATITINDQDKTNIQLDVNATIREKLNNVTNPTGGGIKSTSNNGNIGISIADNTALHLNTSGELVNDAINREHYYYSPQLSGAATSVPSAINQFYDVETSQQVNNEEIREGSLVADPDRRLLVVTKSTTTTPSGNIAISRPLSNVVGPKDITTDTGSHTERGLSILGDAFHPVLRLNIDPRSDNALSLGTNGLYVPHEDAGTGNPTNIGSPKHSITVGGSGFDRTVDVSVSSNPGNQVVLEADGIFVPAQQAPEATKFADITGEPTDNAKLGAALDAKLSKNENHDIPVGGVTGQFLVKNSNGNYDADWKTLDRTVRVDNTTISGNGDDDTLKVKVSNKAGNVLQTDGSAGLFVPQGETKATDIQSNTLSVGGSDFSRTVELKVADITTLASVADKLDAVNHDATLTGSGTSSDTLKVANPVPTGGTTGQVLTKTDSGFNWSDAGSGKPTKLKSSTLDVNNDTDFEPSVNLTSSTVEILNSVANKQGKLTAGANITIDADNKISATIPPQEAGVTKIIAGDSITVSPAGGQGDVTVSVGDIDAGTW